MTNWKANNKNLATVLMMDVNSDITDAYLKSFLANTGLKDVVEHHTPEIAGKNTYIYGQQKWIS